MSSGYFHFSCHGRGFSWWFIAEFLPQDLIWARLDIWHSYPFLPSFGSSSKPHSYNLVAQGTFPTVGLVHSVLSSHVCFEVPSFKLVSACLGLTSVANSIMPLSLLDSFWRFFPFQFCPRIGSWLYLPCCVFFFSPTQVTIHHSPDPGRSTKICSSPCSKGNCGPYGANKSAFCTSIQTLVKSTLILSRQASYHAMSNTLLL